MTQTATVAPTRAASGNRAAAAAGVASAALLFLGVGILSPPFAATDAELVAWWSDDGNLTTTVVSMYLFVASALAFLAFAAALAARIAAGPGGRTPAAVVLAGGTVYATLLITAGAARGVVAKAVSLNDLSLPGVDTLRYLTQLAATVLGVGAMLTAAVAITAASYAILRTQVFGRWLGWLGIVAAVVVLAIQATAVGEFAIPAILIWTVATSAAIWRPPAS
jgi:hypothetical protein